MRSGLPEYWASVKWFNKGILEYTKWHTRVWAASWCILPLQHFSNILITHLVCLTLLNLYYNIINHPFLVSYRSLIKDSTSEWAEAIRCWRIWRSVLQTSTKCREDKVQQYLSIEYRYLSMILKHENWATQVLIDWSD